LRGYGERGSCFESYGMALISLKILTHRYLLDPCEFINILDIALQTGTNAILKPFSVYMGDMEVRN